MVFVATCTQQDELVRVREKLKYVEGQTVLTNRIRLKHFNSGCMGPSIDYYHNVSAGIIAGEATVLDWESVKRNLEVIGLGVEWSFTGVPIAVPVRNLVTFREKYSPDDFPHLTEADIKNRKNSGDIFLGSSVMLNEGYRFDYLVGDDVVGGFKMLWGPGARSGVSGLIEFVKQG